MSELSFEPFPKIPRLKRPCVITEKVDGTNAQLYFNEHGQMLVGSRKREIFPEGTVTGPDAVETIKGTDNFGFARWAYDHQRELFEFLGPGRHYGEWAGRGIQRGYGMDTRRFFLFNVGRFGPGRQEIPTRLYEAGLDVVPVLYEGDFTTDAVDSTMRALFASGSLVNDPVFHEPEGVIVYLTAARELFKVTFDMDDGKWRYP